MRLSRLKSEDGYTMILMMVTMLVVTMVATVALSATNRDLNLTSHDLEQKQAFAAAQAGINDYAYHLNNDTNYWSKCTSVPTPNAVNQVGTTTNQRSVPGTSGNSKYAIELLPASTYTGTPKVCTTGANATASMIESSGAMQGTFRIRSTGYSGGAKRSVVATFKRASFLDYVYFTQLETSDPITYASSSWVQNAYTQCGKTIAAGRYNASIPGSNGQYCDVISFINGEQINGPLHTNDALVVCGSPTFGRNTSDSIEVSSPPVGWYSTSAVPRSGSSCNGNPNFVGTFKTNSPVLTPPATNGQLANIVQPSFKYTGQVKICLNGTNMVIQQGTNACNTTTGAAYSGPIPSNGLIYVANGACSTAYSPYTASYATTSGCGNVLVHGTYTGQLTIAAENDIIVDGNLCRGSCTSPTGNGMLGLIANNFVRVYHPYSAQQARGDCSGGNNGSGLTGSASPSVIDAAMLSIQHSFIVDHYDCGSSLGTLTLHGAISQKFRGPVGTFGSSSTGYSKNYNYDDRLHTISPPNFLDPVQSAWRIQRETLDFQ